MGTEAVVLKIAAQKDAYAMLEVPGQKTGMHVVGGVGFGKDWRALM